MTKSFHYKGHIILGFISLAGAGIFSALSLMTTSLFKNLGSALYNQELKTFTDVSSLLAMDSTYSIFAFLFIFSDSI